MDRNGSENVGGTNHGIVVVGASAGGLAAVSELLSALPADFSAPLVLVQHIHASSSGYLPNLLGKRCRIEVLEVEDKAALQPGRVYVAPANYHVLVEKDATLSLSVEERVNFARPSIDVLFETAADAFREATIGIVLTGANHDGSHGLWAIDQAGGRALVQDPDTAEVETMPRAALAAVPRAVVLRIGEIGPYLADLYRGDQ